MDIYWLQFFGVFIHLLYSRVGGGWGNVRNWDEFDHGKNNVEISNELEQNDKGSNFSFN